MREAKNIRYLEESNPEFDIIRHKLDIFHPIINRDLKKVFVFIHGGTWISGSKDWYSQLGKNFAERDVVSVIINYRLGDTANFRKMALDCATAVKWVYKNIHEYGGDKTSITVCGHSAGGHLGGLISLDNDYFDTLNISNPIKRCILIDAFGLNIGGFIKDHGAMYLDYIEKIFTKDPETWKMASPVNFLSTRKIPFLILVGDKTYPFLIYDNEIFIDKARKYSFNIEFEKVKGKSHMEMITQFQNRNNELYSKLLSFMEEKPSTSSGSHKI